MTKIRCVATLGAVLSLAACGGGGGEQVTNTTSTTTSVATTTTTTAASTTTTTVPAFTAAWRAENLPCVAPSAAPITCQFVASTTGGQAPFTYGWDFATTTNNTAATGQTVRPTITCGLSTGTTSFVLNIVLTVRDATGATAVVRGDQQIAREKGACGTPP